MEGPKDKLSLSPEKPSKEQDQPNSTNKNTLPEQSP